MNKFTKNQDYLNKLFGNVYNGQALLVQQEMAHSLLDYIAKDERTYNIPYQTSVGSTQGLKKPHSVRCLILD